MIAGTLLVIAGLIGLVINRRQQRRSRTIRPTSQVPSRVPSCHRCRIFLTPGHERVGGDVNRRERHRVRRRTLIVLIGFTIWLGTRPATKLRSTLPPPTFPLSASSRRVKNPSPFGAPRKRSSRSRQERLILLQRHGRGFRAPDWASTIRLCQLRNWRHPTSAASLRQSSRERRKRAGAVALWLGRTVYFFYVMFPGMKQRTPRIAPFT
jgi:hypothetical protein